MSEVDQIAEALALTAAEVLGPVVGPGDEQDWGPIQQPPDCERRTSMLGRAGPQVLTAAEALGPLIGPDQESTPYQVWRRGVRAIAYRRTYVRDVFAEQDWGLIRQPTDFEATALEAFEVGQSPESFVRAIFCDVLTEGDDLDAQLKGAAAELVAIEREADEPEHPLAKRRAGLLKPVVRKVPRGLLKDLKQVFDRAAAFTTGFGTTRRDVYAEQARLRAIHRAVVELLRAP